MKPPILIVEDNELNMRLFSDLLSALGYEIRQAQDAESALQILEQEVPGVIVMDIQLPGVSGVDLIEAARKDARLERIPILAVTAFAAKGDEERIRAAGASGYLSKPVSINPFMNAINGLLSEQGEERSKA